MIDKKLLVMSEKKQKRQLFSFFFIRKKIASMLAYRKLYVSRTTQIV